MIVRDALKSLVHDKAKTFFYFLTFTLTVAFVFLYLNMTYCQTEAMGYNLAADHLTVVEAICVAVCFTDIIFANKFFVRNKAKELAVRLVCGATYMQLAAYLLIQTLLILFAAIPFAIGIAYAAIPFLNYLLTAKLGGVFTVHVTGDAMAQFIFILTAFVFWIVLLNLSFAYKNAAAMMLNSTSTSMDNNENTFGNVLKQIPRIIPAVLCIFLYLLPIRQFYVEPDSIMAMSVLGLAGLHGILVFVIIPWLSSRTSHFKTHDPKVLASEGMLRKDLQAMLMTMHLFSGSAFVLLAFVVIVQEEPLELLMIFMSYVVICVLQAMTIMFRYQTELSSRTVHYETLGHLGYTAEEKAAVLRKEVGSFFLILLCTSLFYIVNIFISYVRQGSVTVGFALILTAIPAAGILIVWFITMIYAKKILLTEKVK